MRITGYTGYTGEVDLDAKTEQGFLLPPRFVGKYKKLITRAGFKVARLIKNPFPGVALDYTVRGHQMIVVKTDDDDQWMEIFLLVKKWERMLENEN